MKKEIHITKSEEETFRMGEEISTRWTDPVTILLRGDLGAGKTVLTRGICSGLGLEDLSQVHSPTFSLINQYDTPSGPLFHIDLYRLETSREQYSIGMDEILGERAYVVIEWSEKLKLPVLQAILIDINVKDDDSREISVETLS